MARATDTKDTAKQEVRVIEAAPGTIRLHGETLTVIRCTIMPGFFKFIQTPEYQRELMTTTAKHEELINALGPDGIGVPDDLLLCCRTPGFTSVGAGEIVIHTNVLFTLDGLQRLGAAMARLKQGWQTDPLGAKILLNTNERLERRLFYQVNRLQTKVVTHIHLRNEDDNAAIVALRDMAAKTENFPEIRWSQLPGSGNKITARLLYELAIVLHGYPKDRPFEGVLDALEELTDRIGNIQIAENVKTFFEVVRKCFGRTDMRHYLGRKDFLRGMALLFATYQNFWDKKDTTSLLVLKTDMDKLSSIKWKVVSEALDRNNATAAVSRQMVHHLEKGRATPLQLRDEF